MTRSRRFFASSPWIATGTPDYVNLGYTSRGLAKQALMRLSRKSLAIFRKLGLAIQKSYELLTNYGFFAREICDTCGIVLGAVRFTRHNESEVYCSRECRGDAHRSATLRRGRPRKHKTDRERRAAKTRQQQVYRWHPNVEKTVRIQSQTKGLQTQKSPLS